MPRKIQKNIVIKTLVLATGLLITLTVFGYFITNKQDSRFYLPDDNCTENRLISHSEVLDRLKEKASMAKDYISRNGFDTSCCFLIDMRLPSGKNRFFVYDLLKDSLEAEGLVTHGKGSESQSGELIFSNIPNSKCTSLGKYKIGKPYNGSFGLSYKLMGLERTNSRALDRSVVLHSYFGVPNTEVYPAPISLSEGCPAVSAAFFTRVKAYLDETEKPILLWIYY